MQINVSNIVLYLSFIIWIVYYFLLVSFILIEKNNQTITYGLYIKRNFLKVFRFDKLILIFLFYLYTRLGNEKVLIFLFFIIILFLLVNLLYEEINFKNIKLRENKYYFILLFILMFIPFIYFFITFNYTKTLMFLLIFTFILPFIIYVISVIFKKL
ncbi:MAG: hypothetical protein RSE17_01955 [Bacilli bacterium]